VVRRSRFLALVVLGGLLGSCSATRSARSEATPPVTSLVAGCFGAAAPTETVRPPLPGGPGTLLTVDSTGAVARGGYLIRYPVEELDVRSSADGSVRRCLFATLGHIDAVVTADGTILAATDDGCRSLLERINPLDGRRTMIRAVAESVSDIALSPNGRDLAYLTYPEPDLPCAPSSQPRSPLKERATTGAAMFGPSVLAIVDLATGVTVRTASDAPGHQLSRPAWNPAGDHLADVYLGDLDEIVVVTAAEPDLSTAETIRAPSGCGWIAATWTTTGIVAVKGCGTESPMLSPQALVRLAPNGTAAQQWPLPSCIDGVLTRVDATFAHVIIEAIVGYGDTPPCGAAGEPTQVDLLVVDGETLRAIARLPDLADPPLILDGW